MKNKYTVNTRSVWPFLGVITIIVLAWLQIVGYIIPNFVMLFSQKPEMGNSLQIRLMWFPIVSFIFLAVNICLIVSIFKRLKSFREEGLIQGLIRGFIWGLIISLIVGLIGCNLVGLVGCLIAGLDGLIWGLIIGLICGLTVALIYSFSGLITELKKV